MHTATGTTPPDGRISQVDDVELSVPAQHPTPMVQQRGPVMLPVNEPIQWIRGDLIGAGAFGRVYAGLDEATGQLMAVKQVHIFMMGMASLYAIRDHERKQFWPVGAAV